MEKLFAFLRHAELINYIILPITNSNYCSIFFYFVIHNYLEKEILNLYQLTVKHKG